MTADEREMLAETMPPGAVVVEWHWIDTDGQPPKMKQYLVAIVDGDGHRFMSVAAFADHGWPDWTKTVVAWAELPAFPARAAPPSPSCITRPTAAMPLASSIAARARAGTPTGPPK